MLERRFFGSSLVGALVAVALLLFSPSSRAEPAKPKTPGPFAPREAPMVEVPAGPFLMGAAKGDRYALKREKPQRKIELSRFWIDTYEVTNARYAKCVEAGVCAKAHLQGVKRRGYYANTDAPLQPVVGVTFKDVNDYCHWVGRRLATEVEWEKAARGAEGNIYPWGNDKPTCEHANFNKCGKVALPIGSLPRGASPYGAMDMAGNAIEWTSTPYVGKRLKTIADRDPKDPKRKGWRVIRGGSWGSYFTQTRTSMRRSWKPGFAGHTVGFRCASSVDPKTLGAKR